MIHQAQGRPRNSEPSKHWFVERGCPAVQHPKHKQPHRLRQVHEQPLGFPETLRGLVARNTNESLQPRPSSTTDTRQPRRKGKTRYIHQFDHAPPPFFDFPHRRSVTGGVPHLLYRRTLRGCPIHANAHLAAPALVACFRHRQKTQQTTRGQPTTLQQLPVALHPPTMQYRR